MTTLGEYRVGISFNPSKDPAAMTHVEDAAMWAVKAVTKPALQEL